MTMYRFLRSVCMNIRGVNVLSIVTFMTLYVETHLVENGYVVFEYTYILIPHGAHFTFLISHFVSILYV